MKYYVYILTNWNNKVMYIGVTNDLNRRLYEHKNSMLEGFTKKYNVHNLVYCEETGNINDAISREKQIKGWKRDKKNELVESINPNWCDLSEEDPSLRAAAWSILGAQACVPPARVRPLRMTSICYFDES